MAYRITPDERKHIILFLLKIGLPVCLEDLNMQDVSDKRLYDWCVSHTGEGSFCNNHSFTVDADTLYHAILNADYYGKKIKSVM